MRQRELFIMNNKGQSLVLFVLIVPVLLGVIVMVVDVGNTILVKNKINGIIEMIIEDSLENKYNEDTIVKLLDYNLDDINSTVDISGEMINIKASTYVDGVISNVFDFDGFTIVYTVDKDVPQGTIIKNTANITNIYKKIGDTYNEVDDNDGKNNNKDSDWIQIKATAVALQKYITKVESLNGDTVTYNNRQDHRYNSYSDIAEHKQDW